ncbi:hypothetical protein PR048_014825 [Dryococelus australis]|uniref:Uncharacterized protein n=1 Tax=Dryococelus australis TaxID=614101 RepID=A0ABQ9HF95_9NEOP|nr:hypothetical protein PR048_014825 [Dryococelus australis]
MERWSGEIWPALNIEVLRCGEGEASFSPTTSLDHDLLCIATVGMCVLLEPNSPACQSYYSLRRYSQSQIFPPAGHFSRRSFVLQPLIHSTTPGSEARHIFILDAHDKAGLLMTTFSVITRYNIIIIIVVVIITTTFVFTSSLEPRGNRTWNTGLVGAERITPGRRRRSTALAGHVIRTPNLWREVRAAAVILTSILVSEDFWVVLNSEVLRVDEGEVRRVWSSVGMKGQEKREIPEKIRRAAASSGTIPTCDNPGLIRPGIEHSSPWWELSRLTCQPQRSPHILVSGESACGCGCIGFIRVLSYSGNALFNALPFLFQANA